MTLQDREKEQQEGRSSRHCSLTQSELYCPGSPTRTHWLLGQRDFVSLPTPHYYTIYTPFESPYSTGHYS
ncbi:hypothetical protein NEOLEDRAFT_387884 [Neolentinus lepideus HHB14362 ss-1]|uniref:Uncharacterized protein n=1 Tax=Neolentinus lepideus HHB14362 ss-1 TaxID=1314782 RepID=A0A165SF33_9AGAM|nr:hypothetical protein NEOLEDRAFT_387884 [Neolentinus lepideus HHB14362 ss-1]